MSYNKEYDVYNLMDSFLEENIGGKNNNEIGKNEKTNKESSIGKDDTKSTEAVKRAPTPRSGGNLELPEFLSTPNINNYIDEIKDENIFEEVEEIEDLEDYDNAYYDELGLDGLSPAMREALSWEPEYPKSTEENLISEWNTTGWVGFLHLDQILTEAVMTGASDVHITSDQLIAMSRNGEIIKYDGYVIPDNETMNLLIHDKGILTNQQKAELNINYEYDGSYTIQYGPYKGTRTRLNIGKSFDKYFMVFRIISDYIPSPEDLGIETEIMKWAYYPNGLFLMCGPTGTGKSTTLASIMYDLMKVSSKKIMSIEKPIEYVYPTNTPSLVVQREVGIDTRGFYEGLTAAMRENPDIILLGEVRNTEEVTELLRAAETGHLAVSTMHTNSVATTINRIQNLFSGNEQKRIMSTLSDTLRGVCNQVLVKNNEDGRFAVREILTVNEEIKELISQGDVRGIRNYQIRNNATMEQKLAQAVLDGKCTEENAFAHVVDAQLFFNAIDGK